MSEDNILFQELNFKNMTVLYDGNKISRSVTTKHNITIVLGALLTVCLIIAAAIGISHIVSIELSFLDFILLAFSTTIILVLSLIIINLIDKKITPPHYNLINWLRKHKKMIFILVGLTISILL